MGFRGEQKGYQVLQFMLNKMEFEASQRKFLLSCGWLAARRGQFAPLVPFFLLSQHFGC